MSEDMNFRRIKLSEAATNKLQTFKMRTGLTPNIACRLALGASLAEKGVPSLDLFFDESGQELNRPTLFGDHELLLVSLFLEWCHRHDILPVERFKYFVAHINRGVEVVTSRVHHLSELVHLLPAEA